MTGDQPTGQILCAAAKQGDDLVGTQKTVPVNQPEDLMVTLRQLDWRNRGHTLKMQQSGQPTTVAGMNKTRETLGLSKLFRNVPIRTQERMSPLLLVVRLPRLGVREVGRPERSGG